MKLYWPAIRLRAIQVAIGQELRVLNAVRIQGVIPPNVFTMLVLMAIFSTVITAPFLRIYFSKIGYKYELRPDV